jgi:lysosomal acid lipase/cholesteryl ester hydrolase
MGYYDLPASIDYILSVTQHQKLFYIGHSMGTTMFFVLGATRPEYMAKVEAAVLLAPIAHPYNIRSPLANFINNMQPSLDVSKLERVKII